MKKEKFIVSRKAFEKKFKTLDAIYAGVFIGLLIINIFIAKVIPKSWETFYIILFCILLVVNLPIVFKWHKKMIKSSGLNCASCNEVLISEEASIAISTNKCPYCGKNAFNE